MSEVVQLNLFGDVVNFDNLETNTKEVENDSQLLGTDGSSTLGKISSEEIQSTERTGDIEKELEKAGEQANEMIAELMESGVRRNEALEIVLPQFILLTPEKDQEQKITG